MYTSVNVYTYMGPDAIYTNGKASLSSATGTPQAYLRNGTANVVNGAQYVIVSPSPSSSSSLPSGGSLVPGNQYSIVGAGGLNLVGVYIGTAPSESNGSTTESYRFKVGS